MKARRHSGNRRQSLATRNLPSAYIVFSWASVAVAFGVSTLLIYRDMQDLSLTGAVLMVILLLPAGMVWLRIWIELVRALKLWVTLLLLLFVWPRLALITVVIVIPLLVLSYATYSNLKFRTTRKVV